MNRQIKFRGQTKGEWFYGSYVYLPDSQSHHIIPSGTYKPHVEAFTIDQVEVDPATVGQYTELKDKNGREIYEGDVLLYETPYGDYFGYIAMRYGAYCALGIEPVEYTDEIDIVDVMAMDDVDLRPVCSPLSEGKLRSLKMPPCGECAEIIGNVHDNALFNNLPSRYENVAYIRRQIEQAEIFSYDFQRRLDDIYKANNKQ